MKASTNNQEIIMCAASCFILVRHSTERLSLGVAVELTKEKLVEPVNSSCPLSVELDVSNFIRSQQKVRGSQFWCRRGN